MKHIAQIFLLFILTSNNVLASISLERSRIIFYQGDKSQSVTAVNTSAKPYLLQSLVFDGLKESNEESDCFSVIPPIVVLKDNSRNVLKIIPKNLKSLPNDKESLFYLMVNFIPGVDKKDSIEENNGISTKLNLSTKIVIKLFYRPNGIEGNINDYTNKLTAKQQNNKIIIKNPSPFYMTLININIDGTPYSSDRAPMVSPFSTVELEYAKKASEIELSIINDFGGITNLTPLILN